MQIACLSSCSPLLRAQRSPTPNPNPRFISNASSIPSKTPIHGVPTLSRSLSSPTVSWFSDPPLISDRRRAEGFYVAARSSVVPESSGDSSGKFSESLQPGPRFGLWFLSDPPILSDRGRAEGFSVAASSSSAPESSGKSSGLLQTLQLGSLFGLWYLFNIYFNIYNKQVLKVFPNPMTITTFQFFVGSIFSLLMWTTSIYKRPKISSSQLVAILPLAMVHTLGNLFTNMSLGKVAVSFTHTIKAMEPFFSVLLSALFLGETPTIWVISSLVPIVGGVGLASMTEASFNWVGFWSAMASNVTFQSRNVLSKKFMVKKEESMDNITLFSIITIMSFFLLAPVALFVEGVKFTPSYLQTSGLNLKDIYTRCLLAGMCFHAYQQVSYIILSKVSPITHSVGNCVKRVVVIVTSVLVFRTAVTPINSLGTAVALAGVFLYSRVKKIKAKSA